MWHETDSRQLRANQDLVTVGGRAAELATGFSAAIGFLRGLVRVDERGFARRSDRVVSADQPGLYLVGHNYDATGGLWNIRMDAPRAADMVARASA